MKDIFPISENKKKLGIKEAETEINFIGKKLTPNYIKKLSLILYDSINYKDYAFKRKNLEKTIYKDIGNNQLHLTFKKFPIKLMKQPNNNYSRNIIPNIPNKKYLTKTLDEISEKNDIKIEKSNSNIYKTFMINNDIKKLLYNDKEKIPLQQQRNIYNKFKHKFSYYRPKLMSQLNSPFYTPMAQFRSMNNCFKSTSLDNSLLNKSQIQSISPNYTIDMSNLLKTCNSLKALRDKRRLNKDILNNKQIFCEKIKEELIPDKVKKIKRKVYMPSYDLFYYDAKKWSKFNNKILKNKNGKKLLNNMDREFFTSFKKINNNNSYDDKFLKLNNI